MRKAAPRAAAAAAADQGEVKQLRDQLARLITRNLDLQRQLEDVRRANSDVAVESLAASVVRAIQRAEEALAGLGADERRFVVSQLQTSFRGVLMAQDGQLALRIPLPEHGATASQIGALEMKVAQVPGLAAVDVTKPVVLALERAQSAFTAWQDGGGSALARGIVDQITRLLAAGERLDAAESISALRSLADSLVKFTRAARRELPAEDARELRAVAGTMLELTEAMTAVGRASPSNLEQLAAALERFAVLGSGPSA